MPIAKWTRKSIERLTNEAYVVYRKLQYIIPLDSYEDYEKFSISIKNEYSSQFNFGAFDISNTIPIATKNNIIENFRLTAKNILTKPNTNIEPDEHDINVCIIILQLQIIRFFQIDCNSSIILSPMQMKTLNNNIIQCANYLHERLNNQILLVSDIDRTVTIFDKEIDVTRSPYQLIFFILALLGLVGILIFGSQVLQNFINKSTIYLSLETGGFILSVLGLIGGCSGMCYMESKTAMVKIYYPTYPAYDFLNKLLNDIKVTSSCSNTIDTKFENSSTVNPLSEIIKAQSDLYYYYKKARGRVKHNLDCKDEIKLDENLNKPTL